MNLYCVTLDKVFEEREALERSLLDIGSIKESDAITLKKFKETKATIVGLKEKKKELQKVNQQLLLLKVLMPTS